MTTRREFLKMTGAAGVLIATSSAPPPVAAAPQTMPADTALVRAPFDDDIVIDLEEVLDFDLEVDNNVRHVPAHVGSLETIPRLGYMDERLRVSMFVDEEIRDWVLEAMQSNSRIRVIHKPINLDRRFFVEQATLEVPGRHADITVELVGMLLAN